MENKDLKNSLSTMITGTYEPVFFTKEFQNHTRNSENQNDTQDNQQKDFFNDCFVYFFEIFAFFRATPKGLREAKKKFKNRQETAKRNFETYKRVHEEYLIGIQKQIHIINRCKPIIKDYILKKLSQKLNELGINSNIKDYPMEYLDFRQFPIKDEYNIIEDYNKKYDKKNTEFYNYYFLPNPIIGYLFYIQSLKTIKEQSDKLKEVANSLIKKMKADLQTMKNLEEALENIANIFRELTQTFIPFLEQLIENISRKYNNDYNNIPDECKYSIRICSQILKEITEKQIIMNPSSILVEDVQRYSDILSNSYNNFKEKLNSVA